MSKHVNLLYEVNILITQKSRQPQLEALKSSVHFSSIYYTNLSKNLFR